MSDTASLLREGRALVPEAFDLAHTPLGSNWPRGLYLPSMRPDNWASMTWEQRQDYLDHTNPESKLRASGHQAPESRSPNSAPGTARRAWADACARLNDVHDVLGQLSRAMRHRVSTHIAPHGHASVAGMQQAVDVALHGIEELDADPDGALAELVAELHSAAKAYRDAMREAVPPRPSVITCRRCGASMGYLDEYGAGLCDACICTHCWKKPRQTTPNGLRSKCARCRKAHERNRALLDVNGCTFCAPELLESA